ncbi:MAG: hypothetical protein U9M90_04480 [Patescibacteria group bacterium]|nr:hypothetical protein [Patescibacteria group bacterium]
MKTKQQNLLNQRSSKQQEQNNQSERQNKNDATSEFINGVTESKEFIGVIDTVYVPKGKDVCFFKIEADIINVDGLKDVDFARKSMELPMIKQVYRVAVDDNTKLKNVDKKEDIESGNMVRVVSGSSIYDIKKFTALEVEVIAVR